MIIILMPYTTVFFIWRCLFCCQDGSSKRLGRKEV